MKKQVTISNNDEYVLVTLPLAYAGGRFGLSYNRLDRKFILAVDDENGVLARETNSNRAQLRMSKKVWAPGLQKGRWVIEVSMKRGGGFSTVLDQPDPPRIKNKPQAAAPEERKKAGPNRDAIKAAVSLVNKFVRDNDFEIRVENGQLSLLKEERI